MWKYIREVASTHPFNFFTLIIALLAAAFAGWAALEAHWTRTGADIAAAQQAKDVEHARKAAEKSADAASKLVAATAMSLQVSREALLLNKRAAENASSQFVEQNRPFIRVELYKLSEFNVDFSKSVASKFYAFSMYGRIAVRNIGNTQAINVSLSFPQGALPDGGPDVMVASDLQTTIAPKDVAFVDVRCGGGSMIRTPSGIISPTRTRLLLNRHQFHIVID